MTELSKYELRDKREVYGNDERAINRHSIRVYAIDGIEFIINKTLDGIPPFYQLYYYPEKGVFLLKTRNIFVMAYPGVKPKKKRLKLSENF